MSFCKNCLLDYDVSTTIPIVGCCGHTVCLPCQLRMKQDCPLCKMPSSFIDGNVNHELYNMVAKKKSPDQKNGSEDPRLGELQSLLEDEKKKLELEQQKWAEEKKQLETRAAKAEEEIKYLKINYIVSGDRFAALVKILEQKDQEIQSLLETQNRDDQEQTLWNEEEIKEIFKNPEECAEEDCPEKKRFETERQNWEAERKKAAAHAKEIEGKLENMTVCYKASSGRMDTLFEMMDQKDEEIKRLNLSMQLSSMLHMMQTKEISPPEEDSGRLLDEGFNEEANEDLVNKNAVVKNCGNRLFEAILANAPKQQ